MGLVRLLVIGLFSLNSTLIWAESLSIVLPAHLSPYNLTYTEAKQYEVSSGTNSFVPQAPELAYLGTSASSQNPPQLPPRLIYAQTSIGLVLDFSHCTGGGGSCLGKITGAFCWHDLYTLQTDPRVFPWITTAHPDLNTGLVSISTNLYGSKKLFRFKAMSEIFHWVADGVGGHGEYSCHATQVTLSATSENIMYVMPQQLERVNETNMNVVKFANRFGDANFPYGGPTIVSPLYASIPRMIHIDAERVDAGAYTVLHAPAGSKTCKVEITVENALVGENPNVLVKYQHFSDSSLLGALPVAASFTEQLSLAGSEGASASVARYTFLTEPRPEADDMACNGVTVTLDRIEPDGSTTLIDDLWIRSNENKL